MADNQRKSITVPVILALIVGAGLGYVMHKPADAKTSGKSDSSSVMSAASNLRTDLRSGMQEHAALAAPLLKAALTDSPDLPAAQAAMDKNAVAIADQVNTVYPGKKNDFLKLWNAHLGYYNDYVAATKANDEAGKQTAKSNLTDFVNDLATLLTKANPKLDKDDLVDHLKMHGDQTLKLIDQLATSDFDKAYTTADAAYAHMGEVADMLSEKIEAQYPDKF